MAYYSRLARKSEFRIKRQSTLLIIASIIVLVLFILYGFPFVLSLAGTIGSLAGTKITNTVDKGLAPTTPRFSQEFEATKSAQITLHGVADPKVTVEIFQNERSLGTTLVKDDGTFSMDTDLSRGDNVFTAVAISESGQKSSVSDSYIVSFLSKPPSLEVSSPKDGDTVKDNPIVISGNTDTGVAVAVNDHLAVVSGTGSFSYYLNLNNGDNKIKVVATDKAGNQTTKELTVKYNP